MGRSGVSGGLGHRSGLRPAPRTDLASPLRLFLAVLNSALLILLFFYPEVTWINAGVVAGVAATATLAPRFVKLAPDNSLIPMIAPLTAAAVLVVVLPLVWWVGESITADKRARVSDLIDQLREWTAEVQRIGSRDWSAGGWDDAAQEVEASPDSTGRKPRRVGGGLHPAARSGGGGGSGASAGGECCGPAPRAGPRVSRLRDPAFLL